MSKSFELKGLREKRAKVRNELLKLGQKLKAEERAMSADERETFDKLKTDFVAAGDGIRAAEADLTALEGLLDGGEGEDAPATEDTGAASDRAAKLAGFRSHRPAAPARRGAPTAEQKALSLQGWMRAKSGLPLKRSHKEAMTACGVGPKDK